MKQMLTILGAGFICLMSPTTSHATLLDFTFAFSNTVGSVAGTVTGEIFGLTDNATGPAANVILDSYPAGLGLSMPPLTVFTINAGTNSFTVLAGEITAANYDAFDAMFKASLRLDVLLGDNNVLASTQGSGFVANNDGFAGVTYTPVTVPAPPLATGPVAASVTLLATGLAALWPWCRRGRRTAPA